MITCRRVVEVLSDVVSGQLSRDEREEIEAHLRCCQSRVAFAESYRLIITLTRRLPDVPLPQDMLQSLEVLLKQHRN